MNPQTQIAWGRGYIERTYGRDPTAAPPALRHQADAEALRIAADVMLRRSRKTFVRDVLVKALRDQAGKLSAKENP